MLIILAWDMEKLIWILNKENKLFDIIELIILEGFYEIT